MIVVKLFQLLVFRAKLIFSQCSDKDSMKHLLDLELWYLFKYAKLTKAVIQSDKQFIDSLNKV